MTAAKRKSCVALIGLRGSGKTTVGRELAALLSWPFVDTDNLIMQQAGRSVADLFAAVGEAGFRDRERTAVMTAAAAERTVISVGGGALMDARNTSAIRGAAWVVWLTAPAEALWDRIGHDVRTPGLRPALTDKYGLDEVRHLLAARSRVYEAAADYTVNTQGRGIRDIAEEIIREIPAAVRAIDE